MASFVYNKGAKGLQDGTINFLTDTIKARLVISSVTPNKDDAAMTGHTGVGTDVTLGSKTQTQDDTNDRVVYDAADLAFTAVPTGSTVGTVDIYKDGANDAARVPVASLDITDLPTNGGDITIILNAAGAFYSQQ